MNVTILVVLSNNFIFIFLKPLSHTKLNLQYFLRALLSRRLNTLVLKTIRLNCRDFNRIFTNKELCEMSELRSFNSAGIVNDALKLFTLCTNPTNTILTTRLMQQSVSFSRFPDRISFVDYSRKCIGCTSFINRSKRKNELIPFKWL